MGILNQCTAYMYVFVNVQESLSPEIPEPEVLKERKRKAQRRKKEKVKKLKAKEGRRER